MAMTFDKHTVTETLLDMAEWARDCLTQSEQFSRYITARTCQDDDDHHFVLEHG